MAQSVSQAMSSCRITTVCTWYILNKGWHKTVQAPHSWWEQPHTLFRKNRESNQSLTGKRNNNRGTRSKVNMSYCQPSRGKPRRTSCRLTPIESKILWFVMTSLCSNWRYVTLSDTNTTFFFVTNRDSSVFLGQDVFRASSLLRFVTDTTIRENCIFSCHDWVHYFAFDGADP